MIWHPDNRAIYLFNCFSGVNHRANIYVFCKLSIELTDSVGGIHERKDSPGNHPAGIYNSRNRGEASRVLDLLFVTSGTKRGRFFYVLYVFKDIQDIKEPSPFCPAHCCTHNLLFVRNLKNLPDFVILVKVYSYYHNSSLPMRRDGIIAEL